MAQATPCQTPGAVYSVEAGRTSPYVISANIGLPFPLKLSKQQRRELETSLHNAIELALAPIFRPCGPTYQDQPVVRHDGQSYQVLSRRGTQCECTCGDQTTVLSVAALQAWQAEHQPPSNTA